MGSPRRKTSGPGKHSPLIFVFLVLLFSAASVDAATGLSIQPLKVSHTLNPGQSVSGAIQITNAGEEAVNVEVKVEDFIPLAGTYNIQFVGRAPGVTTVRDWVALDSPKSFILGKGEQRNIEYSIKAPANAEPGGHFGVAFFKASQLPKGGQQLKVGTQVGMLMLVSVPGSRLEKGKILDFSGPFFVQRGPINFRIKFENTGTVHFEPRGTITITNILGKAIGTVPVGGQVVLPTGVKELLARAEIEGLMFGRYKASLQILDGEGNELTADDVAFYSFPLWYLLAFVILAAALFFLFRFLRGRVSISISRKK